MPIDNIIREINKIIVLLDKFPIKIKLSNPTINASTPIINTDFIGLVENDIIPPSEYLSSLYNDHLEFPYILFSGM